jgi:hypothetical protein
VKRAKSEKTMYAEAPHIETNRKVVDAAEAECAFLFETLSASLEVGWKVCPMAVGRDVMVDVVTVVERALL